MRISAISAAIASLALGGTSVGIGVQNDGNLVLYDGATAIWSSGTGGH